jgi:hypothetical protein
MRKLSKSVGTTGTTSLVPVSVVAAERWEQI